MKKTKILAVITACFLLSGICFSSAFALGDGLNALGEYFGLTGNGNGTSEDEDLDANDDISTTWGVPQANADSGVRGILESVIGSAANALSNSQITDILNNFDLNALLGGDSDMLNELMDLVGASRSPTTKNDDDDDDDDEPRQTPTQSYVPQYTNVYVTEAPVVTYSYTPGTTADYGEHFTTTQPETTTLYYIAPSTVYAEQITAYQYDYQVNDGELAEKDGITLKTIIGIVILLISGVAIVGVALSLKKSRI